MNQELTIDFLEKVVGACVFSMPRLLVWDSFRCHISQATKDHLKKLKVHARAATKVRRFEGIR